MAALAVGPLGAAPCRRPRAVSRWAFDQGRLALEPPLLEVGVCLRTGPSAGPPAPTPARERRPGPRVRARCAGPSACRGTVRISLGHPGRGNGSAPTRFSDGPTVLCASHLLENPEADSTGCRPIAREDALDGPFQPALEVVEDARGSRSFPLVDGVGRTRAIISRGLSPRFGRVLRAVAILYHQLPLGRVGGTWQTRRCSGSCGGNPVEVQILSRPPRRALADPQRIAGDQRVSIGAEQRHSTIARRRRAPTPRPPRPAAPADPFNMQLRSPGRATSAGTSSGHRAAASSPGEQDGRTIVASEDGDATARPKPMLLKRTSRPEATAPNTATMIGAAQR